MAEPSKSPPEPPEPALRMVTRSRQNQTSEAAATDRSGTTSDALAEIESLKAEVAELRRANEILRSSAARFAAELDLALRV